MIRLQKVLVATDFNEPSAAALAYGRELARSFGAQLVVLHVVENTLTGAVAANGYIFTDPDLQGAVEAAGQSGVEHLLSADDRAALRAQALIVTSNTPADAIVEYAKDAGINLIVLGTHGRGVMAHLLLGSVAERVVRIAPCPVLTVRHPEREFVTADTPAACVHAETGCRHEAVVGAEDGGAEASNPTASMPFRIHDPAGEIGSAAPGCRCHRSMFFSAC